MEEFLRRHLMNYINGNNKISSWQISFLDTKSTAKQHHEFIDECTAAVDEKKQIDDVFLDFGKTFDTMTQLNFFRYFIS